MTGVPELLPFDTQLLVWGAAWAGDVVEVTAALAEHRPGHWLRDELWDRTSYDLRATERWHGDERLPIPEWWALPAVTEYVVVLEAAR